MNQIVNGFKIVYDYGVVYKNPGINRNRSHYVEVICKECGKQWKTQIQTLAKKKSCGCISWKQLKPLPEYINGFRTIKCLGYDTNKMVRRAVVECKACFREYEVDPNKLQYRKDCGCRKKGVIACKYAKSHPQLTQAIKHMMGRCYNKNDTDYYNYGARGVTICDEWLKDRNTFCEWSIVNGFEEKKGLSIDRIDSSKGYSPENCRWTNAEAQARNTRRVKMTLEGAREMRKIYKESPCYSTILNLAKQYNVSDATVYLIIQNKTWKE